MRGVPNPHRLQRRGIATVIWRKLTYLHAKAKVIEHPNGELSIDAFLDKVLELGMAQYEREEMPHDQSLRELEMKWASRSEGKTSHG